MNNELLDSLKNGDKSELLNILNKISNENMSGNKIPESEISSYIIDLLENENDLVRIKVTEIAENYTGEKIVDKLILKLNNDKNSFVRGFAAKALGSIGNIKAKEALEKASNDNDGFVVNFASQSLKTINMKLSFSNKINMLKLKAIQKNNI